MTVKTVHSKDSWVYVISYTFINNILYTIMSFTQCDRNSLNKNIMGKQAKSNYGVACKLKGGGEGGVIFHKI